MADKPPLKPEEAGPHTQALPPAVQEVIGPQQQLSTLPSSGGENVHIPSDATRLAVKLMTGAGRPQEEIAAAISVSPKTLRQHYREILDTGMAEMNRTVLGKLYKLILDDNPAAIIFYCKTRLNMKEAVDINMAHSIAREAAPIPEARTKELIREVLNEL